MTAQELLTVLIGVNVLLVTPIYVIIGRLSDRVDKLSTNLNLLSISVGIVGDRMDNGRIS